MIYLLAIIGLLALTYLAWRAFGPDAPAMPGQSSNRTQGVPNMIALVREHAARIAAG